MAEYKIMPHNIEAEQSVLGAILIDTHSQGEIFGLMKEEDFYSDSHKSIYQSMYKVYQKSIPVDFVTLTDQLDQDKILDKVGGMEYITTLTNVVPSAANYKYYCDIVKSDSIKRKLIKAGEKIIQDAYESEDENKSLLKAEKEVFDISESQSNSILEHVGAPNGAIKQVIDKFDKIAKDPTSLKGIATGFTEFDHITNGLQNSDLVLLAARPGVGKTSFAMNIIVNAALSGKKCAIFSLEMSREQLMQRAICSLAKVSMAKALNGTMDGEEWKRVWAAAKKLETSEIYIDVSVPTTPADVLTKCRQLKVKNGLDVVMIDYIQLMNAGKSDRKSDTRQNEVSDISRSLKIAAKDLNIPILALSQLSRSVESAQRKDHRPMLSDLRDSGAIEQDADIVLFLYNPEKYNDVAQQDEPGTVELIIAKHRNGSAGTVKLRWIGEYTTFVNRGESVNLSKKKESYSVDQIEETPVEIDTTDVFDK